ncbi:hypothetical protein H6786_02645 [Candidatus Nomurabacteria bacterium]|nr:hypothetical protein [Candidatus Nomurabacteria bacterium]
MSSALEIDGKQLYPIKDIADLVTYSRDYITRLAREQKIVATYVGRQWYVDLNSLKSYVDTINAEQEIRKKQLRLERKRERELRAVAEQQNTLQLKRVQSLHARSLSVATFVLLVGLFSGYVVYEHDMLSSRLIKTPVVSTQVAQAPQPVRTTVSDQSNGPVSDMGAVVVAVPTSSVHSFSADPTHGILLMPQGTSSASATVDMLFSDTVEIYELSDGTQVAAKVDESGRVVGALVPLIEVPVNVRKW